MHPYLGASPMELSGTNLLVDMHRIALQVLLSSKSHSGIGTAPDMQWRTSSPLKAKQNKTKPLTVIQALHSRVFMKCSSAHYKPCVTMRYISE